MGNPKSREFHGIPHPLWVFFLGIPSEGFLAAPTFPWISFPAEEEANEEDVLGEEIEVRNFGFFGIIPVFHVVPGRNSNTLWDLRRFSRPFLGLNPLDLGFWDAWGCWNLG